MSKNKGTDDPFDGLYNIQTGLNKTTIFDLEQQNGEVYWLTKNDNEKLNELFPETRNQWWIRLLLTLKDKHRIVYENWFKEMDKDQSNTIEVEEMMKASWGPKKKSFKLDKETCQRLASIFDPYDKNGDGIRKINQIEFFALEQLVTKAVLIFYAVDQDGNNHVNRDEFKNAMRDLFGIEIDYAKYKMLKDAFGKGLFTNYIKLPEFIKSVAYIGQIMTICQEMEYNKTKQYKFVVLQGTVQQRNEYKKTLNEFVKKVLNLLLYQ